MFTVNGDYVHLPLLFSEIIGVCLVYNFLYFKYNIYMHLMHYMHIIRLPSTKMSVARLFGVRTVLTLLKNTCIQPVNEVHTHKGS